MFNKRIIFFGTGGWELTSRHLEKFLKSKANIVAFVEAPQDKVSSTVTKEDLYESINGAALRLNIPIYCPESNKDTDFINLLIELKPDVFIVCGYQLYLPKQLLDIPSLGVINFHSSLLPRHCGMHPGFWTIWYGDKESGMTVHYMDEGLDTGDIIYRTKVPVLLGDTIETLYDRIWESSIPLVDRLLKDLEKGSLPRESQDRSKYFYNYDITEKDFELDFRQPAEVLYGRVKMMPGKFYFILNGEKYYVRDCSIVEEPVVTRKFRLRVPFIMGKKLVFATPQRFLQIDEIIKNGKEVSKILNW